MKLLKLALLCLVVLVGFVLVAKLRPREPSPGLGRQARAADHAARN